VQFDSLQNSRPHQLASPRAVGKAVAASSLAKLNHAERLRLWLTEQGVTP